METAKKTPIYNLVLLDKSGSMEAIRTEDIIGTCYASGGLIRGGTYSSHSHSTRLLSNKIPFDVLINPNHFRYFKNKFAPFAIFASAIH